MVDRKAGINLDKLNNGAFEAEFASKFCDKLSVQIKEFDRNFEEGIKKGDRRYLSDMVHKITSAIMFIELDEFCDLIGAYKTVDMQDEIAKDNLLAEVHNYCLAIEESLVQFRRN